MRDDDLLTAPVWTIKSLREVSIRFDTIEDTVGCFVLKREGEVVGTLMRSGLSDKQISMFMSLCEYDITKL